MLRNCCSQSTNEENENSQNKKSTRLYPNPLLQIAAGIRLIFPQNQYFKGNKIKSYKITGNSLFSAHLSNRVSLACVVVGWPSLRNVVTLRNLSLLTKKYKLLVSHPSVIVAIVSENILYHINYL